MIFAGELANPNGGEWATKALVDAVAAEKVIVVEYLTIGDPAAWHDNYPNEKTHVGADHSKTFSSYINKEGYNPFMGVISPDFKWEALDPSLANLETGPYALDALEKYY